VSKFENIMRPATATTSKIIVTANTTIVQALISRIKCNIFIKMERSRYNPRLAQKIPGS
jgi:hypothetical protein